MPTEANPNELLLGRGKAYFDRFDSSGNATGLRFMGEVSKIEMTPAVQRAELYTHTRAAANKIASFVKQQTHTLAVDMMEFQSANLALALLGDSVVLNTTQNIVTQEAMTASVTPGNSYQTLNYNISGVTLHQGQGTGAVTLVLGTDYEILDAVNGLIHIFATSPSAKTVVAGSPIYVDYTSAATNFPQVRGGSQPNILGRLLFIGDPANGPVWSAQFWRVQFAPSAAIALLGDDFGTMSISGECLDDSANHPNSPLYTFTQTGLVVG